MTPETAPIEFDVSDFLVQLGPDGLIVLVVLAGILYAKSPKGRAAVKDLFDDLPEWIRVYRLRRMGASKTLARRLQKDPWAKMVEIRGLAGLSRGKIKRTPYGLSVHVGLHGALTFGAVSSRLEQIETGLGAVRGTVRLKPARKADKAVLAIQLRNPLAGSLTWPGHPSGDIRKPVAFGMTEEGAKVELNLLQRIVVAGMSGAGKSVALRLIGVPAVTCANSRLTYIDPKAVEGQLWKNVATVATTPDEIESVTADLKRRMTERLKAMADRGDVDHVPTKEEPAEIIIVDEGAELKRLGLDKAKQVQIDGERTSVPSVVDRIISLAQLGRAADFWLVWASQYPTAQSGGLPVGIGTQAEATVGLKLDGPGAVRQTFGETAADEGWLANHLPGGKNNSGWFYLRDVDHIRPEVSRTYYVSPDDVRSLSRTEPDVLDTSVPAPRTETDVSFVGVPDDLASYVVPDSVSGCVQDKGRTVADDVLSVLLVSETPRGVRDIARTMDKNPGTVQRALVQLVRSGSVMKTDDGYAVAVANRS